MRGLSLKGLRSLLAGTASSATPTQRLKAWRAGFSGTSWLLYDLDNRTHSDYIPDAKQAAMAAIDGPVARSVLKHKLLFERVVGPHARVPAVLAVYERGTVTPFAPDWPSGGAGGIVDRVVESRSPVVLKPIDRSEGRGIVSLEMRGDELHVDKRPATREEAVRAVLASDGALVTEMIFQGGFAQRVFPGSVNTLRVITMVDVDTGEPFVVSAVHRFGTAKSAPTDNTSRGGIRSVVDLDTGRLQAGHAAWAHVKGKHEVFDVHPDTGVRLTGEVLEGWGEVKETVLELVRRLPFLIYVGWDAAITESGVVIIEGNHSPDLWQQVAGPYLADPRVKRFLQHHRVVG